MDVSHALFVRYSSNIDQSYSILLLNIIVSMIPACWTNTTLSGNYSNDHNSSKYSKFVDTDIDDDDCEEFKKCERCVMLGYSKKCRWTAGLCVKEEISVRTNVCYKETTAIKKWIEENLVEYQIAFSYRPSRDEIVFVLLDNERLSNVTYENASYFVRTTVTSPSKSSINVQVDGYPDSVPMETTFRILDDDDGDGVPTTVMILLLLLSIAVVIALILTRISRRYAPLPMTSTTTTYGKSRSRSFSLSSGISFSSIAGTFRQRIPSGSAASSISQYGSKSLFNSTTINAETTGRFGSQSSSSRARATSISTTASDSFGTTF